jgi:hypothetical protein
LLPAALQGAAGPCLVHEDRPCDAPPARDALALGQRAEAGLVRAGQAQASVAAAFLPSPDHPCFDILRDQGISTEDELVLRRVLQADGKSRAFINDQPVSVALLKRLGATLVEVQGQHEQVGLADPATHAGLLDAFGTLDGERSATASASTANKGSISAAAAPTTAALAAPLPRTPHACTSSASSTTNIPAGRRSPSTGSFQQLDVVAAPATPKCPQVSSSNGASSTSASCARSASTLLTAQQRSPDSVSIEGEPQPRTLKAPHNASFRRHCELHACARSASAAPATPGAR